MSRVYNFSAGPAVLPEEVLKEAANEMLDYRGSGMSVMEMSHRSSSFETIIRNAERDLRTLLEIPEDYEVLFLQGGASLQFSMIPMNLMKQRKADYIVTGQWAKKAWKEAEKYGEARVIASSEDRTFSYIPDTKGKPLVADVSSCFLSEPADITQYGIMYGGVQKNIGPAGVTIVIIRKDLISDDVLSGTPTMMRYKIHTDAKSLYNTPPAYGIYICGKVFRWLLDLGGLPEIQKRNQTKAALLYEYLDNSRLFSGTVKKKDRSLMNVPFVTGKKELDEKFIAEAEKEGLVNLRGHRSVGGMRASIYNAMPYAGVEKLVTFLERFEKENG